MSMLTFRYMMLQMPPRALHELVQYFDFETTQKWASIHRSSASRIDKMMHEGVHISISVSHGITFFERWHDGLGTKSQGRLFAAHWVPF